MPVASRLSPGGPSFAGAICMYCKRDTDTNEVRNSRKSLAQHNNQVVQHKDFDFVRLYVKG